MPSAYQRSCPTDSQPAAASTAAGGHTFASRDQMPLMYAPAWPAPAWNRATHGPGAPTGRCLLWRSVAWWWHGGWSRQSRSLGLEHPGGTSSGGPGGSRRTPGGVPR